MSSSIVHYDTYPTRRMPRLSDTLRDYRMIGQLRPEEIKAEEETAVMEDEEFNTSEDAIKPAAIPEPSPHLGTAYGFMYQRGSQSLIVTQPGEKAAIRFQSHCCLSHIGHAEGDADIVIQDAGDYEIGFEIRAYIKASAPVMFELCTNIFVLPGGTFGCTNSNEQECRGTVMAALRENDRISLAIISASVCEAVLSSNGTSAALWLKKLN